MSVTNRTTAPDWTRIPLGEVKLTQGVVDPVADGAVRHLQTKLNEWLRSNGQREIKVDGVFGTETRLALENFQGAERIARDGVFGKDSFQHLQNPSSAGTIPIPKADTKPPAPKLGPVPLPVTKPAHPYEGIARFESTFNLGREDQAKDGKLTVNGTTYDFTAGGQERGNLPPGEYKVERWQPSGPSQHVDGFGYSYRLLKHQDGQWVDTNIRDSRLGVDDRAYFRIHPDGGDKGTFGCIGIRGSKATQQAFKRDMDAAMTQAAREGREYTVTVG